MLRTRVIPVLTIIDGSLVKTKQFKDPRYIGDPLNAAKIFNDAKADELILLDITATKDGKEPNLELIETIADNCFMPITYGGGIKEMGHIEAVLKAGCEKVSINSAASITFIQDASETFGSQSIVASIDYSFDHGYTVSPERMEEYGAGEILLTSVDYDGMMWGYNLELIRIMSSNLTIPLIVCGGAGDLEDFKLAKEAGADAVAATSMFVYYGKNKAVLVNYPTQKELEDLWSV